MKTLHAKITGMHCDACADAVRTALTRSNAVIACDVRVGEADIIFNPDGCGVPELLAAVRGAGTFDVSGFSIEGD